MVDVGIDWLAVFLLLFGVTTELSLILSSWVLLPAGLAVPVILMLTVNVTGAQGMGKLSGLMCFKSCSSSLKPKIINIGVFFKSHLIPKALF